MEKRTRIRLFKNESDRLKCPTCERRVNYDFWSNDCWRIVGADVGKHCPDEKTMAAHNGIELIDEGAE